MGLLFSLFSEKLEIDVSENGINEFSKQLWLKREISVDMATAFGMAVPFNNFDVLDIDKTCNKTLDLIVVS